MWTVHVAHSERVAAEAAASASTASYNESEADRWKRAYTSFVNRRRNVYIQRAHADLRLLPRREPEACGTASPLPKVRENMYVVEICQRYERLVDDTTHSLEESQVPDELGRGFVQRATYRASYQKILECYPDIKDTEKDEAYPGAARFFVAIKNYDTPTEAPIIFSYDVCVCSRRKTPHVRDGGKCKMNLDALQSPASQRSQPQELSSTSSIMLRGFTMRWRWCSSIWYMYRFRCHSKRTPWPSQRRQYLSSLSPGPLKVALRKRTDSPTGVPRRVTFRDTLDLAYYNDVWGVLVHFPCNSTH